MPVSAFDRAQNFIWINARVLESRLFACLFAGGSPEAVITALQAYQNLDGGFGHGLEPDLRSPESQPVACERALLFLDLVGALDDLQVQQEILLPLAGFLNSITTPDGGLPLALPSAKKYPHQPWWAVEDLPPASLNPTASIAGLLLKAGIAHPWLDSAAAYCWRAIAGLDTDAFHTLMPVITFLENVPDRARAEGELQRILGIVRQPGVVELDPQAGGYVKMPLDWAPTPGSPGRIIFDSATLIRHLVALASRQQPDGGWPISWSALGPGAEMEWRGWTTIEALYTLKTYQEAGLAPAGLPGI